MESICREVRQIKIDTSQIPQGVTDDFCRVVLKGVREFFSNMSPAEKEKFERWKDEYHRRKKEKGGSA